MNSSYFALLAIEEHRGVPAWKFRGVFDETLEALKNAYPGGVLPEEFLLPLQVLDDDKKRAQYNALLEAAYSNETVPIGPGQLEPMRQLANALHFEIEVVNEFAARVINLGVPDPPGPHEMPAPEPAKTQQPAVKTGKPDSKGLVDGEMPPITLGNKTFTCSIGWRILTNAQFIEEGGGRRWVKLLWTIPDDYSRAGQSYGMNEYLGCEYADRVWQIGKRYCHFFLQETVSKESFMCCYGLPGEGVMHSFSGLYRKFFWGMRHTDFERRFPGYQLAHDYFGTGEVSTKASMECAIKYVREVTFWTQQAMFGFQYSREDALGWARKFVNLAMQAYGYPPRKLRKYGITSDFST